MPFEEKDPKDYAPKIGLKKSAGQQKSMFEDRPKPPSPQKFQQQVRTVEEIKSGYNARAADLYLQFKKVVLDKTLPQNRNIFNSETEKEILQGMMQLAQEINDDPNEQHNGMGSLTLITCLLKMCLAQRDRINELEYSHLLLQKKLDPAVLGEFVKKEIAKEAKVLDKKSSE